MNKLENDITEKVYKFIYNEISLNDMENWINSLIEKTNLDVENLLLSELISFNFRQRDAGSNLKNILKDAWLNQYSEEIVYERVRRTLKLMIEGMLPINVGCQELSGLYFAGYEIIPYDFEEYYSEMLDIPFPNEYVVWNSEALKEKLEKLELYKIPVIDLSKSFLSELENMKNG
jgi:hypothetical protein